MVRDGISKKTGGVAAKSNSVGHSTGNNTGNSTGDSTGSSTESIHGASNANTTNSKSIKANTTGTSVPNNSNPTVNSFNLIHKALRDAVKDAFNIDTPTPIQDAALKQLLSENSKDVILRSQTGSGKTLAFILPILHNLLVEYTNEEEKSTEESIKKRSLGTLGIIVVPTRELVIQTHQVLERLLAKLCGKYHWIVAGILSGGDKRKSEKARLRKGLHIVVATPGRLLDHLESTEGWRCGSVQRITKWVILDEADRLMDMGFEKSVNKALQIINDGRCDRQEWARLVLCSATVSKTIDMFAGHSLNGPPLVIEAINSDALTKPNKLEIEQRSSDDLQVKFATPVQLKQYVLVSPTKLRLAVLIGLLENLLRKDAKAKVVVFFLCCDEVDYFFNLFTNKELPLLTAAPNLSKLHGNLEQSVRQKTFKEFTKPLQNQQSVLFCTDVAARGLNLDRVTCIIQYDAPCDSADYIHRAGRTARQTEEGQSILLLMPSERDYIQKLRDLGMVLNVKKWEEPLEWLKTAKITIKNVKNNLSRADKHYTTKEARHNKDRQMEEETEVELEGGLRTKFSHWQLGLEQHVGKTPDLYSMAKTAYLASVRAYATHPSQEKGIFHIKKLHLGHLAASFGLKQPPTAFSSGKKQASRNQPSTAPTNNRIKRKRPTENDADHGGPAPKRNGLSMSNRKSISEFGAGDVKAFNSRYTGARSIGKSMSKTEIE